MSDDEDDMSDDKKSDDLIITMADIRKAKMCGPGVKEFLTKHGVSWERFIKEGIPIQELEHIDDVMLRQVIKVARDGRE